MFGTTWHHTWHQAKNSVVSQYSAGVGANRELTNPIFILQTCLTSSTSRVSSAVHDAHIPQIRE
jgi:hypothetical protein